MTALCGGGTSSSKPGFGETIYVLPAALGAFLNNIPTIWAVGAAGYIGKITYNLATFCSTDPPAVPTFTAQDVVDIFNPYNPFTYTNAQQKFQDLVGAFMWHDLCRCDNGTVPSLPTPPAEPTGAPDINPPAVGPGYPTGQPCQHFDLTGTRSSTDNPSTVTGPFAINGATAYTMSATYDVTPPSGFGSYGCDLRFYNASGTFISAAPISAGNGFQDNETDGAVPAGTATFDFHIYGTGGWSGPPMTFLLSVNLYCGTEGPNGGDVPQPCPSDPFVQATLDQILALVTLIQRQNAPFAYVSGATHSGLSGSGSIAVQGLLGMKLAVTDDGLVYSLESGDPDVLWNAGWVNWGNADGVTERQWISSSPFLTMPALAGQFTNFHYSLRPGVTIDATEISREP